MSDPITISPPHDDDEPGTRGILCEREAHVYGGIIRVYRRRADGFRRVEFRFTDNEDESKHVLYFSDAEFSSWHAVFAAEMPADYEPAWKADRAFRRFLRNGS